MSAQIRRVQRRDNGEAEEYGGVPTRSTRSGGTAGKIAFDDAAGIIAICIGAMICAADSLNAGMGIVRWQQGTAGAEAGDDECAKPDAKPSCCVWVFLAQCPPQQAPVVAAGEMQSASPNAGARSTASSSPEAINFPTRIHYHKYTIADIQAISSLPKTRTGELVR